MKKVLQREAPAARPVAERLAQPPRYNPFAEKCDQCDGDGGYEEPQGRCDNWVWVDCFACNGTGRK